ncbi:MAG: hypothetical protein M1821_006605 [Bathelium mastoideum]|nr:MAG: hypothetical protein M1821_006605 [Bathelium mastoideum]
MFLRQIDLTTALRPSLLSEETLLFVQDAVGLYEGKYKLPNHQDGHAYLTSHSIYYVDNSEPRKCSVGIDLKNVDRPELSARFLKSSPKISLFPKSNGRQTLSLRAAGSSSVPSGSPNSASPVHRSPLRSYTASPAPPPARNATWVCPICSFSNPVPENFDPAFANAHTPLPPCLACGIKPPLVHVVKAAIAGIANRGANSTPKTQSDSTTSGRPFDNSNTSSTGPSEIASNVASSAFQCPRCTFQNHPSLLSCEMCGASLVVATDRRLELGANQARSDSPGPSLNTTVPQNDTLELIKLSFRAGGEKIFYERLKGALLQRKWLLQSAPPVPKPTIANSIPDSLANTDGTAISIPSKQTLGIASLERRDLEQRKNNEVVIGNAFEDLEALMTSAKEIIALAESFAQQNPQLASSASTNPSDAEASALLSQSATALGLVTTKDMLGSGSASESLYISELSRNLAEFLTDDATGVLKREGGIISLVDLWALFNRARGGVELVSPRDFERAALLWEKLNLPVRLRRFKSGLLAVQGSDRTDEKTTATILAWFKEFHLEPPSGYAVVDDEGFEVEARVPWDWRLYGRGVTAQETAERFGWSVGVATEELEMCEERGALCREQGIDGVKWWENWLVDHSTGSGSELEGILRGLEGIDV